MISLFDHNVKNIIQMGPDFISVQYTGITCVGEKEVEESVHMTYSKLLRKNMRCKFRLLVRKGLIAN